MAEVRGSHDWYTTTLALLADILTVIAISSVPSL